MKNSTYSFDSNLEQAIKLINENQDFVVISHINPDADAYGSSLSMFLFLKQIGKNVEVVNESGIISRYSALNVITEVKQNISGNFLNNNTVLIVCDCGSANRVGDTFKDIYKTFSKVVNIDHHNSNEMFGQINIFDSKASSTSEIVFRLFEKFNADISVDIAQALLSGIIGDTGYFRYKSTTDKTLKVAARLVELGADISLVAEKIYVTESLNVLKFHAENMNNVESFSNDQIALICIPAEMFTKYNVSKEEADVLVDKIRDVRSVRFAVLIREVEGIWRVSMRTKSEIGDVSVVARDFGGGGHKMAAAFRWKKDLSELKEKLISKLQKLV